MKSMPSVIRNLCTVSSSLLCLVLLVSCATVKPETKLPGQSLNSKKKSEKVRLIFYNASEAALFFESGLIGIKIDNKGIESIGIGSYVQVDVKPGKRRLTLSHVDVVRFTDTYTINARGSRMFIKVYCTPTKTKYKIMGSSKPKDFGKKFKKLRHLR